MGHREPAFLEGLEERRVVEVVEPAEGGLAGVSVEDDVVDVRPPGVPTWTEGTSPLAPAKTRVGQVAADGHHVEQDQAA